MFIPFTYEKFAKKFIDWSSSNGVRDYKLTPIMAPNLICGRIPQLNLIDSSPIVTYDRKSPSIQQLLQITSKDKAIWIDKMNKATQDKSILFSGYFPKIFHSMMKKMRPDSYKEDLHLLRFELLEANCRTFEWYVNMNNWSYKILGKMRAQRKSKPNFEFESKTLEKLCGSKRKRENVHCIHQDRKKKHKD